MIKARRYFVSGRVQGVSFRYYTEKQAREIGINGYVLNLPDRRVEAFAQGTAEQLSMFEEFLHVGPQLANVTSIQVLDEPVDETLNSFQIKF